MNKIYKKYFDFIKLYLTGFSYLAFIVFTEFILRLDISIFKNNIYISIITFVFYGFIIPIILIGLIKYTISNIKKYKLKGSILISFSALVNSISLTAIISTREYMITEFTRVMLVIVATISLFSLIILLIANCDEVI